jgi:hypothetical protein
LKPFAGKHFERCSLKPLTDKGFRGLSKKVVQDENHPFFCNPCPMRLRRDLHVPKKSGKKFCWNTKASKFVAVTKTLK